MDIGTEQEPFIAEPLEDPFRKPAPASEPPPERQPEQPKPEPVKP